MRGDFTRDTFDRAKHFSRVLMQQGRVQLDSDWNEQTDIVLHYLRALARDLIGPYAGPNDRLGFRIVTDPDDAELKALPSPRKEVLLKAVKNGDFAIDVGRYYVQGVLVENEHWLSYTEQRGYPFSEAAKLDHIKDKDGLVYLDVWERHITYVEDDHIREPALNGPDTCSRTQIIWQVKVLLPANSDDKLDCDSVNDLLPLGTGRLRARARFDKEPPQLCVIPPEAKYRGAENQLYRVEIHQGGTPVDGATFKWSRENGAVVFPIRTLSGTVAVVEHLGRDKHLSLHEGNWVEIVDDDIALSELPGVLAQVGSVDRDELTVSLTALAGLSLPTYGAADAGRHPLLRRWDHTGDPNAGGAIPVVEQATTAEAWIPLEDGIQIAFTKENGIYRTGDYWLIPARTVTGDVDWPKEGNTEMGQSLPPHGPRHWFAPLAHLTDDPTKTESCLCVIQPITKCDHAKRPTPAPERPRRPPR